MFWHLKNRIKEETGNDVDLIPSIVNSSHTKLSKDKQSESSTSLGSFTIDSSKEEEEEEGKSNLDMKLADGKVIINN